MNAMASYMSWLSQDMPFGVSPEGRGFVKVNKELEPNSETGKKLFAEKCSVCHGADGEGQYMLMVLTFTQQSQATSLLMMAQAWRVHIPPRPLLKVKCRSVRAIH